MLARAAVRPRAEDQLVLQELNRCLSALAPEQREALVMVTVQGLSYQEVARRTGVAEGTAKCRVFRARRLLQRMLLGEERPLVPAAQGQAESPPPRRRIGAPANRQVRTTERLPP